jgi:hypothetical protein
MQTAAEEVFIKQIDMMVAAKIIQLVASGIYRTPANAIKELISNAFDADATRVDVLVDIDEKNEKVNKIIIQDNGTGINSSDFAFSMTHIGSSLKKIEGDVTRMGRPIIGRIGIGLLSVGQATNRFEFLSATRDGLGMRAEVDLSPYYDAITMTESLDTLKIGNVKLFRFENPSKKSYTKITLGDLKEPFVRGLVGRSEHRENFDFKENPSYEAFVKWLDEKEIKRLDEISPFNRFMFELGLLTPVRYLPDGPVKGEKTAVLTKIKQRLENYNFHVYVNDVEIFKPILFPHTSDLPLPGKEPYKVYEKEFDLEFNNRRIIAKCYYYHQDVRILPYELRGLLLRVKNVAIGTYENSFSKIASESPVVLHQLTGELYVDEGFDSALNIDRNSFFESDEAYQRLWLEVLAWVNPEQLPSEALKYVKPAVHPVSRDIRQRLELIGKKKKEKRSEKARNLLMERLSKIVAKGGYPTEFPPELKIVIDPRSRMRADIRFENNHAQITATLNRRYGEAIQNVLVLILTAQRIAMMISHGSTQEFENAFSKIITETKLD